MNKILKILNLFIWVWNTFKYFGHLENCRHSEEELAPYDFEENDTKYF